MTVQYLDLVDYLAIAETITGLDEAILLKVVNLGHAHFALHASSSSPPTALSRSSNAGITPARVQENAEVILQGT